MTTDAGLAVAQTRITRHFFTGPVLLAADRFESLRAARLTDATLARLLADDDEPTAPVPTPEITNAIAVVPIVGELLKRTDEIDRLLGFTSYEDVQAMVEAAVADERVAGILLSIDSPGGQVAGCFECADAIRALRGRGKPIVALANDHALSGAYALASAADQVFVTSLGAVGSIGVYTARLDVTGLDEKLGITVELFAKGAKKTFGNPHTAVSKAERAEIDARLTTIFAVFRDTVAANRGMQAAAVEALEAGIFLGRDLTPGSVAHELVDGIGTVDSALAALREQITARAPSSRTVTRRGGMTDAGKAAAGGTAPVVSAGDPPEQPAPTPPTPPAPEPPAPAEARAAGNVIDINAERTRLRAEMAADANEIKALCKLAARGDAQLEAHYLAECMADPAVTAKTASAKILTLQAAESEATHINGHRPSGGAQPSRVEHDAPGAVAAEYAERRRIHAEARAAFFGGRA